ncbi:hypothetical protein L6259_00550 [Candidatus Parcubacteria bacterium]|nr:hypothetical protein [Candidatus Parcubacteria bacterium]
MLTSSEITKMKKKELQEACEKLLRRCTKLQRDNKRLRKENVCKDRHIEYTSSRLVDIGE